jgi:hypothetical protein
VNELLKKKKNRCRHEWMWQQQHFIHSPADPTDRTQSCDMTMLFATTVEWEKLKRAM